mmetsp:Transcript_20003/g.24258  ORF Transcript_20003/g.24258 Transcript_20003/m.24258 type:complete len:248 (-) Transcript_20003:1004-1747(-)
MFAGSTKQLAIFVLASVVAFYQLSKSRMFIERAQSQAQDQLQKAQVHLSRIAQKNGTHFQFFYVDDARFHNQKTLLVVIPASKVQPPIIAGELYMDPAAIRSAQKPKDPRYKYKHNGRHKRGSKNQRKAKSSTLVFKVHDSSLLDIAANMVDTGFINRLVQGKYLALAQPQNQGSTETVIESEIEKENSSINVKPKTRNDISDMLNTLQETKKCSEKIAPLKTCAENHPDTCCVSNSCEKTSGVVEL